MGLINSCTCEGVRLTHSKCDLCRAQEFNSLETLIDTEAVFQRRIGLIHRTWAVDSLVESWSELARRESNSSQNWPEFSSVNNPADDPRLGKVFPIAYRFPDIRKARMCLYCWAGRILLQRTLRLTYKNARRTSRRLHGSKSTLNN